MHLKKESKSSSSGELIFTSNEKKMFPGESGLVILTNLNDPSELGRLNLTTNDFQNSQDQTEIEREWEEIITYLQQVICLEFFSPGKFRYVTPLTLSTSMQVLFSYCQPCGFLRISIN